MTSKSKVIVSAIATLSGVIGLELYRQDATLLGSFGLTADKLTTHTIWLTHCLAGMYLAQAALLLSAAVMMNAHARRAVAWAVCGGHLFLAESVLHLRSQLAPSEVAAPDMHLSAAMMGHFACAAALIVAVFYDISDEDTTAAASARKGDNNKAQSTPSSAAASASANDDDDDDNVPLARAHVNVPPNANKAELMDPDGVQPKSPVDWKSVQKTTISMGGASTSASSSPEQRNAKKKK